MGIKNQKFLVGWIDFWNALPASEKIDIIKDWESRGDLAFHDAFERYRNGRPLPVD